jgi:hypothetical protein
MYSGIHPQTQKKKDKKLNINTCSLHNAQCVVHDEWTCIAKEALQKSTDFFYQKSIRTKARKLMCQLRKADGR